MIRKNELIESKKLVVMLFIVAVIAHGLVGFFYKAIAIYPDELRYYQIARSLYEGNGLQIRGINTDFQKIAYAIILAPFFAIKNVDLRLKIISCFNALLMMSSIVPIWKIGEELELSKKTKNIICIGFMILPDILMTITFMSEVLYWPLFFWFVYIWIKNQKTAKIKYAIVLGVLCYFGYFTKEIFLANFLACIFFEITYPLIQRIIGEEGYKEKRLIYKKDRGINLLFFVVAFSICYLLFKITIFKGMGNSYNQQSIDAILSGYNFLYMLYAFGYYIAAILISVMIIPIIYCITFFDSFAVIEKKLFAFILIFLGIASATIVYTISVREDLGKITPRFHFRYIAPAIIILLIVFVYALEKIELQEIRKRVSRIGIIGILGTGYVVTVFKGLPNMTIDEFVLKWYMQLSNRFKNFSIDNTELSIQTGVLFINIMLIIGVLIFFVLILKEKKWAIEFAALIFIVICASDNYITQHNIYGDYKVDAEMVKEVENISQYFEKEKDYGTILYLTGGDPINTLSRVMDTYMDVIDKVLFVDTSSICGMYSETEINVPENDFRENIWENVYQGINEVNYIIVENPNDTFLNVQKIPEISGKNFTVYKNLNSSKIYIRHVMDLSANAFLQNENVEVNEEYKILNTNGIIYGPYKEFEAGRYKITYYGDNLENCKFDVWSEVEKTLFDMSEVKQAKGEISFIVNLTSNISDLEMRLYNEDDIKVKFDGIRVEREEE